MPTEELCVGARVRHKHFCHCEDFCHYKDGIILDVLTPLNLRRVKWADGSIKWHPKEYIEVIEENRPRIKSIWGIWG
jgi:hypothetical protein